MAEGDKAQQTRAKAPVDLVDRVRREALRLVRGPGKIAGLVGLVALGRACFSGSPPPKTLDGLIEALGASAHVVVRPNDFVWEATEGILPDFTRGRRILFLGADKVGAPRDLYRARVRLSPEGRPLEVREVVNLTSTPYGDEQGLVRDATAERAAFATYAYGQLQGLTALDLRGEGRAAKTQGALDRMMLWVTNTQETGDGRGIARVQVGLEKDATSAVLHFEGSVLVAQLAQASGGTKIARIDVDKAELASPIEGVRVELLMRIPKRPIHWAVDTVRAIPWIGPEPIAWLEAKVWELKDRWKRFRHGIGHTAPTDQVKANVDQIVAKPLDASAAGEDGGYWPPQPVPTIYTTPEPGEGTWTPVEYGWMRKIDGAPPTFYRTFVRPDPLRPYSKIILVAMDTRQLDFDVEAGVEDPKPTVGSFHGSGRLPRDANVAKRVVAAWNGGFKTEHGYYGMAIKHRVLLPPVPNAASAVVMEDGRFGMGSWLPSRDIPADVLSYRQNMDPLIEDGIMNPRKRGQWGAVLVGQKNLSGQQTERSGLCITKAHHLFYVWGDDVGADAMAKAMQLAGCDYGMHLDMNPFHTGFVFMTFEDKDYKTGHSETLTNLMAIGNRRYIDYNPKDFFFATLRDPSRPMLTTAGGSPIMWVPDGGIQPQPTWVPSIWRAKEGEVSLTMIEPSRVRFLVRAGTDEHIKDKSVHDVSGDDAKRVIGAIGLGVSDHKHPFGLMITGKPTIPLSTNESTLVIRADGNVAMLPPGEPIPAGATDAVQGPTLIHDGHAGDALKHGASIKRIALGVTKDGRLVIASANAESDEPLTTALLAAGCTRAIAARGHVDGFLARAGTGEPPMSTYSQTVLYLLAQPLGPRAFRFDRAPDGKPLWPLVSKAVP